MESLNLTEWKKTMYCGELHAAHVGKKVTLFGWVHRFRDMGSLIFIDLRDREGLIQIVVSGEDKELLAKARNTRMETVLGVRGVVEERGEKDKNPRISTGEVEVRAKDMIIFNTADVSPFVVSDPVQASEELRFKYRYLDLRRPSMQKNLKLRHQAAIKTRNYFNDKGFYEIETPFLTKSTPEGARDYLVPSRMYKGRFFALPQSPQLFKQLLMISGFDRYFQIVRCFRDEDLRADRQPEFTQIDVEMSFVEMADIFDLTENLMVELFGLIDISVSSPFPRLTYEESISRFGTDKPDLRFGMEISDLTETGKQVGSRIIQDAIASGSFLKALVVKRAGNLSRGRLDKLNQKARDLGGKGIIWIKKQDEFKSSIKLEEEDFKLFWNKSGANNEDLLLLVADERYKAANILGEIRNDLGQEENNKGQMFSFVWVTDFPLFEWSKEEERLVSMHHPFTSPVDEDLSLLSQDPARVSAKAYDLVLNGVEIGGGSIRIHNLDLQKKIFGKLGLSKKEYEEKFGFFLEALRYGAPPHGGIALGFDRIVMILAGEESIREVIAFPKTTSSLSLLTNAPSPATEKQIADLGLKLTDQK